MTDDPVLYTVNQLNSYSFGAPQFGVGTSRTINPLAPDELDDHAVPPLDVTPRPSVASTTPGHNGEISPSNPILRSHQSHLFPGHHPNIAPYPRSAKNRSRNRSRTRSDAASHRTFGSSSASASVASLSSLDRDDSGSNTRQTSAPSTDDDRDDPDYPDSSLHGDEFSSDEDYDDDYYDNDDDPDGHRIEIGSARYEESIQGDGAYRFGPTSTIPSDPYRPSSITSSRSGIGSLITTSSAYSYRDRRGSVPIAIPGSTPEDGYRGREDSVATVRRPSRSLGEELAGFHFHQPDSEANNDSSTNGGSGSVPESDSDWRSYHARRMKERGSISSASSGPPLSNSNVTTSISYAGYSTTAPPLAGQTVVTSSALEGFDSSWSTDLRGGIVTYDPDDFVQTTQPTAPATGRRPSGVAGFFSLSFGNLRRPSYASSNFVPDTFERELVRNDREGYASDRRLLSFKREQADGSGPGSSSSGSRASKIATRLLGVERDLVGLSSLSSVGSSSSGALAAEEREKREREREKERERERRSPAHWKGMPIGTGEVWRNPLLGRYLVDRKATNPVDDPAKGPQQRLIITHFRDGNQMLTDHRSPPVTAHKHSKAQAFSITRVYKTKRQRPPPSQPLHRIPTSSSTMSSPRASTTYSRYPRPPPSRDSAFSRQSSAMPNPVIPDPTSRLVPSPGWKPPMTLLAPLNVQIAFTNTNTTRQLQSHGQLDDNKPDAEREREKAKEKEREKRKREEAKRKEKEKEKKDKGKGKGKSTSSKKSDVEREQLSSSGSVSSTFRQTSTSASTSTTSMSGSASNSMSAITYATAAISESNVRRPAFDYDAPRRLRDGDHLFESPEEEDVPRRPPHSETYSTVGASEIERLRARHPAVSEGKFALGRFLSSKSSHSAYDNYNPPWVVLNTRNTQEKHQRLMENLSNSFMDVGLLPSSDSRKRAVTSSQQKRSRSSKGTTVAPDLDVFDQVSQDALFMILPLWPGETDAMSYAKYGYEKIDIPAEQRQYLLVCYNPVEVPPSSSQQSSWMSSSRSKTSLELKKKARSPTSSSDSGNRMEERSVLLHSFSIKARMLRYKHLQGSGIRIPDQGLSVSGALNEAYRTMPPLGVNDGMTDYLLGNCDSREGGFIFYREGLQRFGLCLPNSQAETSSIMGGTEDNWGHSEPLPELTAIGRAVMEMAWAGGMALTSFGSITS